MALPSRIVIATDFSEGADQAAEVAMAWAQRLGAELHWCHALERRSEVTSPRAAPFVTAYVEKARQEGSENLAASVEAARRQGVDSEAHLVEAPAGRGVIELVEKLGADCVIVGSRGNGLLANLLLGSVAERIARHAPCRVLVARGEHTPDAPGTIVLGDDLSELSAAARSDAFALARALGARVDMVHAPDLGIPYLSSVISAMPEQVFDDIREEASRQMDEILADAAPAVEIRKVIARDAPAHAISDHAKETHAGLVVVGTRARTDIERTLLGSVADRVMRHAPCSVLVAR